MNKINIEKIKEYLTLPYTYILEKHIETGKSYYSMRVLELDGCLTTGDIPEEVTRDIQDALREWLTLNIKLERPIPEPIKSRKYSGKIILRMPPALHESLTFQAAQQGVSLNQYLVASLSHTLGYDEGIRTVAKRSERTGKAKTKTKN